MNLKTGIVILALLALCFFAGVGNGLLRTNDTSVGDPTPTPPNWSKKMDSLFRVKATVDDIRSSTPSSCLIDRDNQTLTVPASQLCSYRLSTAFLPRSLELATSGSAIVTIRQPIKEDGTTDKTAEKTLAGTSETFNISSRQSKNDEILLEIFCPFGCVLEIR